VGVRRRGRELALQMLYQYELAGTDVDRILEGLEELDDAPAASRKFAVDLVRGVLARRDEIDGIIGGQADNWRLDRMAAVDRNILRVALYELIYQTDTPPAVVIDEAVEVAKRFGSERSSQFVNGILDGFVHRQPPAREA
jgi:N utilization substance protein B